MSRFLLSCLVGCALMMAAAGARAEPPVILIFGDSLSAGYGLPQGKGWVDLLEQKLAREKNGARVVNASISGETSLGGRNRLAAALSQYRPQLVVLELGANDALRGQSLPTLRENLAAMVKQSQAAGAKVLLLGMRIPPNYGQDYTKKFHALYADVARQSGAALVPFLFAGFAERREMFQPDGVHPGIEAQPIMRDNVWAALERMPAMRNAKQ
ncbi:MAG: arylesterase [Betaproteobacteria bacterium]